MMATAELAPVARVGGLAEAVAGLVSALRSAGVEVQVVLPDYDDVSVDGQTSVAVDVPSWAGEVRVRRGRDESGGDLTLVHVPGMDRPHPYVDESGGGWPDNDHRFMAFSAVVAALAEADRPDVLHLNDWHTAAAVGMSAALPPTVLTIHTLGYQGTADRSWLQRLPVETDRFAWFDGTNPLAGAIELVDRVIAVSPNYAAEIVTPVAGMGLDERLGRLGDRLVGIRNGIDVGIWNPETDDLIAARFRPGDTTGRALCRNDLAATAGWESDRRPIIAMVTRLVEQKGIDLALDVLSLLSTMPARLAVLGAGAPALSGRLRSAADANPDDVWFCDGFDATLAHQLFAGSDLFLMPSRFEPCGLAQMQAMAYGSIPVVTDVGGLRDTVVDADRNRSTGTGFVSSKVDSTGVVDALHRAVRATRHSARRQAIQRRGMEIDWSWDEPAARHLDLYRQIS